MQLNNEFSPNPDSVHFSEIRKSLSAFQPISLKEMDSVMLFDRVDMKFVFHVDFLPGILDAIKDEYKALEVLNTRIHTYHSLYFDNPDLEHYYRHHNLRRSRYKFRHRIYVESDLHFFEIKEKTKNDRTVKSRILKAAKVTTLDDSCKNLVRENAGVDPSNLSPMLWSNFHRITLVHKERQERMTIDINLLFVQNDLSSVYKTSNTVILELKQEKKNFTILLLRELIKRGIRPLGISKYTMGVYFLYDEARKNNFIPLDRLIDKIENRK
ncbi:MAG: polyphosphate polymerase domain-containing protein [Bacteroidia bacterium]